MARWNCDYLIIQASRVLPTTSEIVLGHNEDNKVTPYVTWESNNGYDFFWGHYFADYKSAKLDFLERIQTQIEICKRLIEIDEENENET